jgi:hypothetical protein
MTNHVKDQTLSTSGLFDSSFLIEVAKEFGLPSRSAYWGSGRRRMASEVALPFGLAAARWPSWHPSKGQILPLNREYESPAEMTSTNCHDVECSHHAVSRASSQSQRRMMSQLAVFISAGDSFSLLRAIIRAIRGAGSEPRGCQLEDRLGEAPDAGAQYCDEPRPVHRLKCPGMSMTWLVAVEGPF